MKYIIYIPGYTLSDPLEFTECIKWAIGHLDSPGAPKKEVQMYMTEEHKFNKKNINPEDKVWLACQKTVVHKTGREGLTFYLIDHEQYQADQQRKVEEAAMDAQLPSKEKG